MTLFLPALRAGLQARRAYFTLGLMTALAACSSPNEDSPGGGAGRGGTAGASGSAGTAGKAAMAGNGAGGKASGGSGTGGAAGSASEGGTTRGGSDAQGGEGGMDPNGPGTEEFGFTLRKPGEKNLDWLCTFNSDAESGYVYVRLLQTGTNNQGLTEIPIYSAELAQLSVNGMVSTLQNAQYDYGGGHHNDALSFDYGGKTHRYYHSSFGFGFRSCQPMDCRDIHALGTTTLETEGCAATRSLPETCVEIGADGNHAALVDNFEKCPGDPG